MWIKVVVILNICFQAVHIKLRWVWCVGRALLVLCCYRDVFKSPPLTPALGAGGFRYE